MVQCPDIVKRLIERFNQQLDQVRSPDYNETELRIDYVNPMYAALGPWGGTWTTPAATRNSTGMSSTRTA
jgi:hypothetical protein